MNDWLYLALSMAAGLALGLFFFGGLWWTVQRSLASPQIALWMIVSLVVRVSVVLVGFRLACGDDWRRWLAALLGFTAARLLVARATRNPVLLPDADHAP